MINDFQADNFLERLNSDSSTGTVVDVAVVDNGHFLVLFQHSLKLLTYNGEALSLITLEKKAFSLGRYANAFVVPCESKMLFFVEIIDSTLHMFKSIRTKVQFSGASAVATDSLVCVARDEWKVYIYNERVCVKTVDLTSYGMTLSSRTSSLRIRLNLSGHIIVFDHENKFALHLWDNENHSVVHCVDCPSNIAAGKEHIYIVQGGPGNCVFGVRLDDHGKVGILDKDEDGIISRNSVSGKTRGVFMVEMENNQLTAIPYQNNNKKLKRRKKKMKTFFPGLFFFF